MIVKREWSHSMMYKVKAGSILGSDWWTCASCYRGLAQKTQKYWPTTTTRPDIGKILLRNILYLLIFFGSIHNERNCFSISLFLLYIFFNEPETRKSRNCNRKRIEKTGSPKTRSKLTNYPNQLLRFFRTGWRRRRGTNKVVWFWISGCCISMESPGRIATYAEMRNSLFG